MELWVTGDRSALSLETNANYFRENLFHRASLCWLGRKDQIYSPRLSSSQLHIPFPPPPRLLFLLFPPKTHCSCSLPVVKAQLESWRGREQFWGAGLRWAPAALLCPVLGGSQQLPLSMCHHPQLLLAQVFQTPLLILYKYKASSSALLMGNSHISA